jgi:hypothetical protein
MVPHPEIVQYQLLANIKLQTAHKMAEFRKWLLINTATGYDV